MMRGASKFDLVRAESDNGMRRKNRAVMNNLGNKRNFVRVVQVEDILRGIDAYENEVVTTVSQDGVQQHNVRLCYIKVL